MGGGGINKCEKEGGGGGWVWIFSCLNKVQSATVVGKIKCGSFRERELKKA